MDAAKDYVAGLTAGVATVLVGHPFDTVKVNYMKPKPCIIFAIKSMFH